MRSPRWLALVACTLALATARADEIADSRRARALADSLMSPFCPGRTLSDCPSPNASAIRDEIRTWVAAGKTDAEIRTELRTRYGDTLSGEPESAWGTALPLVLITLLGIAFAIAIRRVVARSPPPA